MENPKLSDEELKSKLTPEEYHILREGGTEAPFSGKLLSNKETGIYTCAACGAQLFSSSAKFEATEPGLAGWPSFDDPVAKEAIELREDHSDGMSRTEVICRNCGSHLGHLFQAGDSKTGEHYCINSACLNFQPKENK